MQRQPISSGSLREISYQNGTLEITFVTGTVYRYFDVPARIYDELIAAESKGAFFNLRIRDQFRYARV